MDAVFTEKLLGFGISHLKLYKFLHREVLLTGTLK